MAMVKSGLNRLCPRLSQYKMSMTCNASTTVNASRVNAGPLVAIEVDASGIATVSMQRPPVNILNLEFLSALRQTILHLEKDKCTGFILISACLNVFTAGLDIKEFYKPDKERFALFWREFQNMWLDLYTCSMPSVAAINGHSPAGGCLLAMACEYRIMVGPKFKIGLNEVQLGITSPRWMNNLMRDIISKRQTEMALTRGALLKADEALKIGLVDEIVDSKEIALERGRHFIGQFQKIPAVARAASKLKFRNESISWMKKNQEEDTETMLNYITQPEAQNWLGLYIESLKKKT